MTFLQNIFSGNKIVYDKNQIIGSGSFAHVFRGKFNNIEVAVKRVELIRVDKKTEEEAFKTLGYHENVVQLLHAENREKEFR